MAYTVLARRYRSQTFDDVVGQDALAQTLKNAIQTGRVAHAYLFTGTRGVGKTTMARILAKALNCLKADGPTTQPCLKCDSCVSINTGDDIDVIEIDGASNTGVDNIRQLRQNAIYRPARARFKIYIIDEVHMLSTGAFNALLKILEEPPEHVKFIFATTEPNKVLPTIQSRCQRFDFHSIRPTDIARQLEFILKQEKITYENDLIIHLSRLANGSMRDALSLMDQLISTGSEPLTVALLRELVGQSGREDLCGLLGHIGSRQASTVLQSIDVLLRNGQNPSQIVDSLIDMMRDLIVLKSTSADSDLLILTDHEKQQMSKLAEAFDVAALIYGITALERLRWTIRNSESARALLEATLLRLTLSEHFIGIDQLLTRQASGKTQPINPVKKKSIESSPQAFSANKTGEALFEDDRPAPIHVNVDPTLDSIQSEWPAILEAVKQTSPANVGFLSAGKPSSFADGSLTLMFPATAEFARKMCQARAEVLAEILARVTGIDIQLYFETGHVPEASVTRTKGARTSHRQNQEVLDDPVVRTLLVGLNASVTQIEAIGQDS
ncbi:MAG: DNA polymerase III subunit gamma/tau [Sedimentisphaerales bacterium]|nr:DNA polymerase III subunit gamma/tau [Sedimentisphaerales bacterium]